MANIKDMYPLICTHRIASEDDAKPIIQMQCRLNLAMKQVVKAKVLKLLDDSIIYPIEDSKWVSPTQIVPETNGVTVVRNKDGEMVPTLNAMI